MSSIRHYPTPNDSNYEKKELKELRKERIKRIESI